MSTCYYLECLAHSPSIIADKESAWKSDQVPQIREDWKNREVLWEAFDNGMLNESIGFESPRMATIRFMESHRNCPVQIRDEYGTAFSIEHPEDEADNPVSLADQIKNAISAQYSTWLEGFDTDNVEAWTPASNKGPDGIGRIDVEAISKIAAEVADRAS